jgi:hypothetical protein
VVDMIKLSVVKKRVITIVVAFASVIIIGICPLFS